MIPEEFLPPPKHSWKKVLSALSKKDQDVFLKKFQDADVAQFLNDGFLGSRREQLPPPGDWFLWMLMCGRGFGKTHAGSSFVAEKHASGEWKNSGIIAATASDLRRFCVVGSSGILNTAPAGFKPEYKPGINQLIWPNGTITLLFTAEKPERLRGPNLDGFWADELSWWRYVEETWDNLMFSLRLGDNPQGVITMTPRPIKIIRDLMSRKDVRVVSGSTYDNIDNLAGVFIERIEEQYAGTRLGRQELFGELLEDVVGALWTHDDIRHLSSTDTPVLIRKGIGVDPSITGGEKSDETGIIAAGITKDRPHKGVVLGDYSLRGSPDKWASRVVFAYYKHEADFVIAERNQGGEMVRAVIHHKDPTIPVHLVHAKEGKVARAEPVAALYEQGRVFHQGYFPLLEDQMCTYIPGEGRIVGGKRVLESPDRMDALVYVLKKLMVDFRARGGAWGRRFDKSRENKRAA